MLLGYLYQVQSGPSLYFNKVDVKLSLTPYINQTRKALSDEDKTVCRWTVFRRLGKKEEVFSE